jgi:hypothetical protein
LRYCIENIAYEKIKLYNNRIPTKVLETWQPPQLFKFLQQYEPQSLNNFSLSICKDDKFGVPTGNWIHLGNHKTFNLKWLRKNYNKLGKFLHLPTIKENINEETITSEMKSLLAEVIKVLEEIINQSTVDSAIAKVVEWVCIKCGSYLCYNLEGLKNHPDIICFNDDCKAEYYAIINSESNEPQIVLKKTDFECQTCGNKIEVENKNLKINYEFSCSNCHTKHTIFEKQWMYGKS